MTKRPNIRKSTPDEKKKFTAHKFDLLNKAVLDADLTDLQYRLFAYIVGKYLWKPGDTAYPGADHLIDEFGASRTAIWDALDKFEARGYFICVMRGKRGRGENRASVYVLGDGPKTYQRRIHKPRKSNASNNQTTVQTIVCGGNQTTVQTDPDYRLDGRQTTVQTVPNSMEGTLWKEHTQQKDVCRTGKKKDKPTPDRSDDDAPEMEFFRSLPGCSSPDRSKPNGGNGHDPTSPATDLDRAVATYTAALANHPHRVSRPDVIRREMAKVLERTSLDVFMAALTHHQTNVWSRKLRDVSYIPTPENFLLNHTWENNTPPDVLAAAREDHRRRQEEPPQYEEHARPIRPVDADDEITVLETRLRDDPGLSADERDDLTERVYR